MRIFIGIDLPVHIKKNILELQLELKQLGVKGLWKSQDNFHITLEFLGEIKEEKAKTIKEVLLKIASGHTKFTLNLRGLGSFPSFNKPHTLWTAVTGDIEQLNKLRDDIHKELKRNGFSLDERPFKPHITIASRPEIGLADFSLFVDKSFAEICAGEIVLFESKVINGKRSYPHLFEAKLSDL